MWLALSRKATKTLCHSLRWPRYKKHALLRQTPRLAWLVNLTVPSDCLEGHGVLSTDTHAQTRMGHNPPKPPSTHIQSVLTQRIRIVCHLASRMLFSSQTSGCNLRTVVPTLSHTHTHG